MARLRSAFASFLLFPRHLKLSLLSSAGADRRAGVTRRICQGAGDGRQKSRRPRLLTGGVES